MDLISAVSCGHCGKPHRIHRDLARGVRYRFYCKRCGAEVEFGLTSVRWSAQGPPPPPPLALVPLHGRDTLSEGRPPVHITPLVRRGIERDHESSRVTWLRARQRGGKTDSWPRGGSSEP